jgi:hypothetical protein
MQDQWKMRLEKDHKIYAGNLPYVGQFTVIKLC